MNLGLFAGVSGWLLWRRRSRRFVAGLDALLLIAGLSAALLLVVPDAGAGGSMLVVRLAIFPFLALLLWWGAQPIGSQGFRRVRLACTIVSTAVVLLLFASLCFSYPRMVPYLQDIESGILHTEPNSTLLIARMEDLNARLQFHGPDVFRNAGYRRAAERGIVIVNCWPAATNYMSIQYRPGLHPWNDPVVDITALATRAGKPIDYVLVVTDGAISDAPSAPHIVEQLADSYDLVFSSPQTGCAELYRRKNWGRPTDSRSNESHSD